MKTAKTRPAAAFVTCPYCSETIMSVPAQPGGDLLPYWRIEDAPAPRDVKCRCGETSRLTAPWHKPGVYPALDIARALCQQIQAQALTHTLRLAPRQYEVAPEPIRRPVGYEPGAGDAWAVWWQDVHGNRHEIVIIGDVTAGPLVTGQLNDELRAYCTTKGWRL